ncbi:hypothetical protein POK33_29285 [Burkholderia cenocepacia]|uniref:hypothetical protein n=1 Tax=Burkholderia cenocepacia TaxID=95486 RepID=UPI0023B922E8|nr:hypothetical protein [Burkholderia cenocepacia]MDF0504832.1 hypothetical protein [Burkholderia cenocepacia]
MNAAKQSIPAIRISYCDQTKNRHIESGKGKTYRCYGIALNDAAAKKLAAQVRAELRGA